MNINLPFAIKNQIKKKKLKTHLFFWRTMFTIYENNEPEPIFSPFTYTRGIKKNPSQSVWISRHCQQMA